MATGNKQFGRPRTFKLHTDRQTLVTDPQQSERTVNQLQREGSPAMQQWLRDEPDMLKTPPMLYPKVPAAFNDPRCVFYVLDTICDAMRGTYIRPSYVQFYLQSRSPQYYWDVGIVGRIMAGLATVNMENYGAPSVEGTTHEENERMVPFVRSKDARGRYYVVDPQGGDEGLLWLLKSRRIFLGLAVKQMKSDSNGEFKAHFGGMSQPANYYFDHLYFTIRTLAAYRGQLAPTTHFNELAGAAIEQERVGKYLSPQHVEQL